MEEELNNQIHPDYIKYLQHTLKNHSGDKKSDILRRTAHIAINQFIKKNFSNSLENDRLIKDLPDERIEELLENKHAMSQFIIGHLMTYHNDLFDENIFSNLIKMEPEFMMLNYVDFMMKEYSSLIFGKHFNEAYLYQPEKVDKYIRERFGRDTDIKKLYSKLARINMK